MSEKNTTSDKGSVWRKWDLHIHTPGTKLSDNFKLDNNGDIWSVYCEKLEKSDVSVFGITDYFSCENYYTFTEKFYSLYPDSKKIFFPNIEFRLPISVNKKGEEINIHVIFSNEIVKSSIDDFLTSLKTNFSTASGAKVSCKNIQTDQFESATINHDDIQNCLDEVFGKERPYIILAASNNAGIRPTNSPRKMSITDEIDKLCDAFFGGRQNVEYFLKKDRYETDEVAKAKPVICGCDAHSFEDVNDFLGKHVTKVNSQGKVEILKDITWIKSDLTFEGLKQIIFEPEYRVRISENEPRIPVRRIESIKFNFPPSTVIQRKNSTEQQDFCLKNLKQSIHLSDYFTCIIGGRGTGKSTIINILAEKLNEETDFFSRSDIKVNGLAYDIENDPDNYIEIIGTNEVEFVSQGRIERLAEANELTKLIFNERIKEIESEFIQIESEYDNIVEHIDDNIDLIFKIVSNSKSKKEKEKEKETIQKIIDSINDKRYIEITNEIKSLNEELTAIENSKKNYKELLGVLKRVSLEYEPIDNLNDIDFRIQEITSSLMQLEEFQKNKEGLEVVSKEFEKVDKRIVEINNSLEIETINLRNFFKEKGTNEETIKDSQKASEILSKISSDIDNIDKLNERNKSDYIENRGVIDGLQNLYDKNNSLIKSNLDEINDKLKINNENVLEINFTYEFDFLKYKESLFKEFYSTFNEYHISGTSEARVKEVLFLVDPSIELLNLNYKTFKQRLENALEENNYRRVNKYVQVVTDIFDNSGSYMVYLDLIRKHRYNLSEYIKINGFYGKKELESCSFGQRCTAVIVTLLMTGVKPLIIDEPEAHLDNKLVADYLVDLVKEKQFDRQIIFASHNSNFVINGDSALIHILEIPNNSVYTSVTSTTIENTSNREKLLKLEGGREAFLNRESKYGI